MSSKTFEVGNEPTFASWQWKNVPEKLRLREKVDSQTTHIDLVFLKKKEKPLIHPKNRK